MLDVSPFLILILLLLMLMVVIRGIWRPTFVMTLIAVIAPLSNIVSFGPLKLIYLLAALQFGAVALNPNWRRHLRVPVASIYVLGSILFVITIAFVVGGMSAPRVYVGLVGSLALVLVALALFRTQYDIRRWMYFFAFAVAASDVVAVTMAVVLPSTRDLIFAIGSSGVRLQGFFGNPNLFAGAQVLALPILLHFLLTRKKLLRLLGASASLAVFGALLATQSRSAIGGFFIATACAILLVLARRSQASRAKVIVAGGVVLSVMIVGFLNLPEEIMGFELSRLSSASDSSVYAISADSVEEERLELFLAGLQTIREYPLGVGLRHDTPQVIGNVTGIYYTPHNSLITSLVIFGVVGGLFFNLVWLGIGGYLFWQCWKSELGDLFLVFLWAAVGGYIIHGLFHSVTNWIYMWIVWGLAYQCTRLFRRDREPLLQGTTGQANFPQ